MATNVIWKIGIHPTGGTAKPTIPALGSHVTMTGFTTIGSVARGDDCDLDEESVEIPFMREYSLVKPPVALGAADHVLKSAGATDFSFTAYDISKSLLALDSNMATATNTTTFTTTTSKRTVMIEINGVQSYYFPQCIVQVDSVAAGISGDDAAAKTQVTIKPEGTSSIPGGVAIDNFVSA